MKQQFTDVELESTLTASEHTDIFNEDIMEKTSCGGKEGNSQDSFCWQCHRDSVDTGCNSCPRSWHWKCLKGPTESQSPDWICYECLRVSEMNKLHYNCTVEYFSTLLKHLVNKMHRICRSKLFWKEYTEKRYQEFIVNPMDLELLEQYIEVKKYHNGAAFMADVKWIFHNWYLANSERSKHEKKKIIDKFNKIVNDLIELASKDTSQIEFCPHCYEYFEQMDPEEALVIDFTDPCKVPHIVVWAKFNHYPYWPAKVFSHRMNKGTIDVRFFGAKHERADVPLENIYLYCKQQPLNNGSITAPIQNCMDEVEEYFKNLEPKYGKFNFAPPKTRFNPADFTQIQILLPEYDFSQCDTYQNFVNYYVKSGNVGSIRTEYETKNRKSTKRKSNSVGDDSNPKIHIHGISDTNKKIRREGILRDKANKMIDNHYRNIHHSEQSYRQSKLSVKSHTFDDVGKIHLQDNQQQKFFSKIHTDITKQCSVNLEPLDINIQRFQDEKKPLHTVAEKSPIKTHINFNSNIKSSNTERLSSFTIPILAFGSTDPESKSDLILDFDSIAQRFIRELEQIRTFNALSSWKCEETFETIVMQFIEELENPFEDSAIVSQKEMEKSELIQKMITERTKDIDFNYNRIL